MKRKITKFAIIVCIAMLSCGVLTACNRKVDAEILRNVSEISTNIYTAQTDNVEVTLMTGERETPYNVNGISETRGYYSILTVKPINATEDTVLYDYVIKTGKNEYRGKLNLHPFGIAYTDTLSKKVEGETTLTLTSGDATEEIILNPQFNDSMLTWEDALNTGIKSVKKEVDSLYSGKKLMAEVYVRFMSDPLNEAGEYYWYVAVVGNNGKTYGALINPLSGQVMATKKI